MWKKSLAIIAIGSLVTGSSFANPLNVKNIFMQNKTFKSSVASKKHSLNSQSKFSGTWTGICSSSGATQEMKIKINDDSYGLSITDLLSESDIEEHAYNIVETAGNSDKDWYDTFTSRLTKMDENTIKFEGTGVASNQLNSSNKETGLFLSGVFTSMYTVNNNQLTIDTNGKVFLAGQNMNFDVTCNLQKSQ